MEIKEEKKRAVTMDNKDQQWTLQNESKKKYNESKRNRKVKQMKVQTGKKLKSNQLKIAKEL